MMRSSLKAEVYERRHEPGVFVVEAIDTESEGEVYMATFTGPGSKERAVEYAEAKYAGVECVRRALG